MEAMTDDKDRAALERLKRALVEDILAAPDPEILAEVQEDGSEPEAVAAAVRALFEKTVAAGKKARLAAAQAAVAADRRRHLAAVPSDPAEARRRLTLLLARHPETAGKLTLAARKGQSGDLSDDEVRGLLEDLQDLGLSAGEEPENRQ
jgi:hypothetical protein